jgi:hypothetical protein
VQFPTCYVMRVTDARSFGFDHAYSISRGVLLIGMSSAG